MFVFKATQLTRAGKGEGASLQARGAPKPCSETAERVVAPLVLCRVRRAVPPAQGAVLPGRRAKRRRLPCLGAQSSGGVSYVWRTWATGEAGREAHWTTSGQVPLAWQDGAATRKDRSSRRPQPRSKLLDWPDLGWGLGLGLGVPLTAPHLFSTPKLKAGLPLGGSQAATACASLCYGLTARSLTDGALPAPAAAATLGLGKAPEWRSGGQRQWLGFFPFSGLLPELILGTLLQVKGPEDALEPCPRRLSVGLASFLLQTREKERRRPGPLG